jgi:hypothetical protein
MVSTKSIIRVLIRDHRVNRGEERLRTINGAEGGPTERKSFLPKPLEKEEAAEQQTEQPKTK